MKVWIDEGCIVCRACEEICPDVFEVDDENCYVIEENIDGNEDLIKEAAEQCPVEVIIIEDEDDEDLDNGDKNDEDEDDEDEDEDDR